MLGGEAELHIKGISIDCDRISRGSYLRDITSIAGVSSLTSKSKKGSGVGKNGFIRTREEALSYGLSFPDTYQDAPFHDDH